MYDLSLFDGIFDMLVETHASHSKNTRHYDFLNGLCKKVIRGSALSNTTPHPIDFDVFGKIIFPYQKMGAVDSIDLFGLDELIIFAFYWANRSRYRTTVDIGGNIGLHSILMQRCGFSVTTFEPDPFHFEILSKNIERNCTLSLVNLVAAAVSEREGTMDFVRVKGNTTGSHLAGSKSNPYGDLDRFKVPVKRFADVAKNADLLKIDAEGHEAVIIKSLPLDHWQHVDAIVEISTPENAIDLFSFFKGTPIRLMSQNKNWARVASADDMPKSHKDGSLFITTKNKMPWD